MKQVAPVVKIFALVVKKVAPVAKKVAPMSENIVGWGRMVEKDSVSSGDQAWCGFGADQGT